jgi:hypothetical protein
LSLVATVDALLTVGVFNQEQSTVRNLLTVGTHLIMDNINNIITKSNYAH